MALDFFYNLIIFPLVQIIEIAFVVVFSIFRNKALAIIGVSAAVTICTMPLYFIAEKWQNAERALQKKLKPKVDKIKTVFRGDVQYMCLSAYYRQNHYHPAYALRNSFGILIQIPFFIAAYSYLSRLDFIKGVSFLFISDLGAPDKLFSVGGFTFNILPLLMTLINCASGAVYTKGLPVRDKVQIYGMAAVFFVLLYNSPSGLVLYWTMNNIFSLLKNIISKTNRGPKIVYLFLCLCACLVIIRFIPVGFSPKRLFVAGFCSLIFFAPLFLKLFQYAKKRIAGFVELEQSSLAANSTYILSALILFFLSGLVIPGSLIASSVQEFSFLDSYTSPFPFIYTVSVQAAGIFLFWPICVYFLFSKKVKYALSLVLALLCVSALANTFIFPGDYGFMTTTFRFFNSDTLESKYASIITSSIVTLGILGLFTCMLLSRRKFIFHSFAAIVLTALLVFTTINIGKINIDFKLYEKLRKDFSTSVPMTENPEPVYKFSRNGKNVLVIMLDAAISGYFPIIFEERPDLHEAFSGFTYYPNFISYGRHTRIGAPPLFGGYEYVPEKIQLNRSFAREKHNESLLMMPRIFQQENYHVTVTDPACANYSLKPDLSIFAPYPEIVAKNTQGNYTGLWLRSHPELEIVSIPGLLRELLIRFSFLKISPPAFRVFIYDKASWLKPGGNITNNQLTLDTLDCYTTLDYLPQLTEVSDEAFDTYTSMVNELTHDSALFQYPDYVPAMNITNYGSGPFADDNSYHSNIAAFLLLKKWFGHLQEENVYDNLKIVIASDHGKPVVSKYEGNILLPNGEWLSSFHSLLLVKDFNRRGNLAIDKTFTPQGEVPAITMKGLIDNPQNLFSGNRIESNKNDSVLITTADVLQFTIDNNQWLQVQDNIFDPANWKEVKR